MVNLNGSLAVALYWHIGGRTRARNRIRVTCVTSRLPLKEIERYTHRWITTISMQCVQQVIHSVAHWRLTEGRTPARNGTCVTSVKSHSPKSAIWRCTGGYTRVESRTRVTCVKNGLLTVVLWWYNRGHTQARSLTRATSVIRVSPITEVWRFTDENIRVKNRTRANCVANRSLTADL